MPGTPVKLLWSREEDMAHGRYHPVMQCKLVGALRCQQQPDRAAHAAVGPVDPRRPCVRRAWQNGQATRSTFQGLMPGTGEHSFGYSIPNLLIDHAMRNPHIPPGFWRGVNINQNAIFIECFMDELAQAAGQDRARVPAQADEQASEQPRRAQRGGRADRLGQAGAAGRLSRPCADEGVRQLRGGGARKSRSTAATRSRSTASSAPTDPGYAVNPAQIDRQVAGSFVYGLSALFYQECTVKDGRIEQTNFDTYNSMRIAEMPKVESIVMPSGGSDPGAASASRRSAWPRPRCSTRIFKATGKRIRSFPLKNHNIQMS
mgnify:CR=1 FL=1